MCFRAASQRAPVSSSLTHTLLRYIIFQAQLLRKYREFPKVTFAQSVPHELIYPVASFKLTSAVDKCPKTAIKGDLFMCL